MRLPKLKKPQKPTKRQLKQFVFHALIIVLGNAIAAAASAFFIIPNNLTMGGTTGLGIFIGKFWENEFAVSLVVYVLNIALYILGVILLGKKFAVSTLTGTVLYPTFLSLWTIINNKYFSEVPITGANNEFFAAVFGGMIFGFGIGMVVRVGASTGGTDIPALIFNKFFNLPVSIGMWVSDFAIILIQLVRCSIENVLYGFVVAIISSVVISLVSPIGMRKTQVLIVSKKYREIREMILNKLHRGVTMLYAKTGFLKERTFVLMTIVSNRDLVKLRNEIQTIDSEAFLMVSTISEVRGRGFSSEKISLPLSEEKQDLDEVDISDIKE